MRRAIRARNATRSLLLLSILVSIVESKKQLVIDSDGVSDDVRAISLALQHPDIEVLAITTSSGSTNSSQAAANIARALRANNAKVPIYRGADRPLLRTPIDYTFVRGYFGIDGLGDLPNAYPKVLPSDFHAYVPNTSAAQALVEVFRKHRNATLVVTGPLTNVALAINLEPEFAKWPAKMIVMGGNVYAFGDSGTSTAESNFHTDAEAAYTVLKEMKCPITIVTWESALFAGEKHAVDFYAHLRLKAPLSKFLATATSGPRAYLSKLNHPTYSQYFFCDSITVGMAIEEERMIESVQVRRATIELHGQRTRGQVAIDWSQRSDGVPYDNSTIGDYRPITFLVNYNATYLNQLIFDAIKHAGMPWQ